MQAICHHNPKDFAACTCAQACYVLEEGTHAVYAPRVCRMTRTAACARTPPLWTTGGPPLTLRVPLVHAG